MSIKWDASQLAALSATLESAGDGLGDKARAAVHKAAADIEQQAKARAPVDTGHLRSSISTTLTGNKHHSSAEVGPTAHYGRYVEQGTSRMAAQPYLVPAMDAVEPGFVAAMAQLGAEVIR